MRWLSSSRDPFWRDDLCVVLRQGSIRPWRRLGRNRARPSSIYKALLVLLSLFICSADAAFVVNNAGRHISGTKISASEDGSVSLTTASGQTMTFRKGQYRSATADRPKELTRAEHLLKQGQGEQAVPLLRQVKQECRYLAWDQAAIQLLADYYYSAGQFVEAVKEFQALEDQTDADIQRKLRESMMKSGAGESVLSVLNEDIATGSRDAAAQAYLMRGELKAEMGDLEGARRDWLKVTTFFKAQKKLAAQAEEKLGEKNDRHEEAQGAAEKKAAAQRKYTSVEWVFVSLAPLCG